MVNNKTRFCTTFNAGIPVVQVFGDLDHAVSKSCRTAFTELAEAGYKHIIADLSELQYMDSSGLSVIIFSAKQLHELGGYLILVGGNSIVMRKFDIGGLDAFPNFIVKCSSMEEALEHLYNN